ncbi:hypothetical protein RND81_02G250800 [Saponaria officinalis]|uniref:peptidylprolyl isomerase n=1 Tax=Saponaria officinalis TaxID=3572 RepID=A0AAW1MX24_SAPOF
MSAGSAMWISGMKCCWFNQSASSFQTRWQGRFDLPKPCDPLNFITGSVNPSCMTEIEVLDRRQVIFSFLGVITGASINAGAVPFIPDIASASDFADMPALRGKDYGKTKMRYPDYTETDSGLQYKDLRMGTGPNPKIGETVVVDWDGYTIGYYGRIFEARNKTKGGSFEGNDKDFFKFKIGSQEVIPAFEEAVKGMSMGGIRRIIVPPELGYPEYDYNKKGPRPTTFSGQRALAFVLRNQGLIDKTLLFDIELVKIISQ